MRRNNYRSCFSLANGLRLALLFAALISAKGFAQTSEKLPYTVISSNEHEVILSIHPEYQIHTISDEKTGESYDQIAFPGGSVKDIPVGAPAAQWLPIRLLAPSYEPVTIQILSEEYAPALNAKLSPVPKRVFVNGIPQEHYIADNGLYKSSGSDKSSTVKPVLQNIFRTAYTQQLRINTVSFDAASHQIRMLKAMTVKITFPQTTVPNESFSVTPQEEELFQGLFVNGNVSEFYRAAASERTKAILPNSVSYKQITTSLTGEKWAAITTTDQGVYHITASQLAQAGISNPDPATIQLFGYGGATVPEDIDSATGELQECTIDVLTNGDGSLNEIRFYDPGNNEWYYNPESGTPIFGLYHLLNPFTNSGHFLLRAGGTASSKRIQTMPDNVVSPVSQNTVPTVAIHEDEERFEDPGFSREFLGEEIPNGRDVTISLPDLPGYTSDSTVVRPAFNVHDTQPATFNFSVNGTAFLPIVNIFNLSSGSDQWTARNWTSEILANNILHAQNNSMTMSASTTESDTHFWLDFVEIFYRRQASLSSGQVPFYVLADGRTLNYNFTDAGSGEAWNVSNPCNPVKVATSSGSSLNIPVQGDANGFKQFIAFNSASLKTPAIVSTGTMALRNGICQSGAQDIIVTPKDFLDAANNLAKQRTMGGQATPPMSVAVVTVEDIYREFGYGSNDYTAIRNFMSYMFRHTTANKTTIPLYLTLFSNGHADYRNKTTQALVGVPIYETWRDGNRPANAQSPGFFRSNEPEYVPDDTYYTRLTQGSMALDVAVGRVVVHTADEAAAFVSKVVKYETSSDEGDWRSKASFICDDRYAEDGLRIPDAIVHINDSKSEQAEVPERILQNDIYGQAYTNVSTAVGRRKPEMEKAVTDAFNNGSALISWVGHGNPTVWAHEAILTVPTDINKMTNFNRLTFLTTATCDFSRYDNLGSPVSGGVLLITKPDGGAIASLGTSRSVFGSEPLVPAFFRTLLETGCNDVTGSAPIGVAYMAGIAESRNSGFGDNGQKFYIMGDPSQRIIIPRQYVTIDSINGIPFNEQDKPRIIPALSKLTISGHISNNCDGSAADPSFNGNVTLTLFDAPTGVSVTSTFLESAPITDTWTIDGPILYHGSSTVTGGSFRTSFIVPKDIKFDTNQAKISLLAYSDNFHSALGVAKNIVIYGIDTSSFAGNRNGPTLTPYIGSRAFKSGDIVTANSKIIVDVADITGLNSSTSSIGHSFIAWTDDSTTGAIDLSPGYVSEKDDYTKGTSIEQAQLPIGTHILHVRAFDALDNVTFAEVQFTARGDAPYSLYDTRITPNPVTSTGAFTFLQPAAPESPVDVTINVYSVIGQKVRELSAQSISQNDVSIPFDARDDSGALLTDGVYLFNVNVRQRLSGSETNSAGSFVIMRGQ